MEKLPNTEFLTKIKYLTWLAKVVLVRNANNKWRMCMDFTDLNVAYHKDPHPLSGIYRLIKGSSSYRILHFIDAYSGYNQI